MSRRMRVACVQSCVAAAIWILATVAAESSSGSCPAVYSDNSSSSIQPALDSAQQVSILSQRLEETEHLLHLSYSHPPNSGFRYGTFFSGMSVALLLVGVTAFLCWSFIQQKVQRKQQVAVVGGLKDMDDKTLKKVLGQVRPPHFLLARHNGNRPGASIKYAMPDCWHGIAERLDFTAVRLGFARCMLPAPGSLVIQHV